MGQLAGFALLLPLSLVAVGIWQTDRGGQIEERIAAQVARIAPETVPRGPVPIIVKTMIGAVTVRDLPLAHARVAAARVTAVAGAIAVLAVLAGLAAVALASRRGRASRGTLVTAFGVLVRFLPIPIGITSLGIAVAVVAAVAFEVSGAWFVEGFSVAESKLIVAGLSIAAGALALAFAQLRVLFRALGEFEATPTPTLGVVVDDVQAPGLWALLRVVASRLGAPIPDDVVLGSTRGFFVTTSPVRVEPDGIVLNGRTLHLPAVMVPFLAPTELATVVAHEFAHYTGEDTLYTERFLPLHSGLVSRLVAAVGTSRGLSRTEAVLVPGGALALLAIESFRREIARWSRSRELRADQACLQVASAGTMAATLIRINVVSDIADRVIDQTLRRPGEASADFVGRVLDFVGEAALPDATAALHRRQPHPTDSHPSTRQRIEALGIVIDGTLLAEACRPPGPAERAFPHRLFADWDGLRARIGSDLLARATAIDARTEAGLRAIAASAPEEETAFFARLSLALMGRLSLGAFLVAVAGATAGLFWLGKITIREAPGLSVAALAFGLGGARLMWITARRLARSRRHPFLVLDPSGFRCDGLAGHVPWSAVAGIETSEAWTFVTSFRMKAWVSLPERDRHSWSVKVDPIGHAVRLWDCAPRGMSRQAYGDALDRALSAYRARATLTAKAASRPPSEPSRRGVAPEVQL